MEPNAEEYPGDRFLSHFSLRTVAIFERDCQSIPEYFYTQTGLPVITPDNVQLFLSHWKLHNCAVLVWELYSGSSRLSSALFHKGSAVLFPVDYRYGWDINYPPHQQLLTEVYNTVAILVLFGSPDYAEWNECTPMAQSARETLRCLSRVGLQWKYTLNKAQAKANRGFIDETLYFSDIFTDSPLKNNTTLPRYVS